MAFKMKGSHHYGKNPLKQLQPRDESMEPTGPRDEEGWFETKGHEYSSDVKTRPTTDKSKGVTTGDTEVVQTWSNRWTDPETGKVYSTIRGPSAERETETSIVGPKGKQKGKTKVVHDNPVSGDKDWMTKTEERDDSNMFSGNRKYDPKTRAFKMKGWSPFTQKLPTYKEAWEKMSDKDKTKHGSYKEFEKSAKDYNKEKEKKKADEEFMKIISTTRYGDSKKK